jgi:hypothetical protein
MVGFLKRAEQEDYYDRDTNFNLSLWPPDHESDSACLTNGLTPAIFYVTMTCRPTIALALWR